MLTWKSKMMIMSKKNGILSFSGLVCALLVFSGCSSYSKLLKSNDHEQMYQKALEYYGVKKYQRTIQLLTEIAPYNVGTAREDTISYYVGASYYKQGDFESSSTMFDDFRRKFNRSPFIEDVEYMYALGFYYSSPPANRDQTNSRQAVYAINEYLSRYPETTKKEYLQKCIEELTSKFYQKSYNNAHLYYKIGRYKSAVVALKNAITEYPDSPYREELTYLLFKSSYLLAENSIDKLKRDRYLSSMDYYYNFVAEFPESKMRKDADKMMGSVKNAVAKYEKTSGESITEEK